MILLDDVMSHVARECLVTKRDDAACWMQDVRKLCASVGILCGSTVNSVCCGL